MTHDFVAPRDWPGAPDDLVKTQTGARLHVPACPHIGSDIRSATPTELEDLTVCTWCQAELDGHGRTYFRDLTEALREFGVHVANQAKVRDALQGVVHDVLWMPNSRSYVALGRDQRAVAWFGKTYAMPSRTDVVELPDYASSGKDGMRLADEARGEVCVTHFVERSVTGECEMCA